MKLTKAELDYTNKAYYEALYQMASDLNICGFISYNALATIAKKIARAKRKNTSGSK